MYALIAVCVRSVLALGATPRSGEAATIFIATLDGDSARPTPVVTAASGFGRVELNESEDMVTATVTWAGLASDAVIAAHFHFPADSENVAPPLADAASCSAARG